MEFSKQLPVICLLLFIAITFLFSFWDKVSDWKGNISFLKEHFKNTFVASIVPISLFIITFLELLAGIGAVVGIFNYLKGSNGVGVMACLMAIIVLFIFLIGQRIAKDFDGAMKIVVYLIPTIFCLYLLTNGINL
ncbi:DoxX family protein [Galbibacter mesophilus]|uniref:DoxX family protein n=1 Tax=Galbibacter mesophilus TaxID=379069 RepID=UPI00191D9258|nr:DoxX family protein [Galbibacter mesophilus]MCM5662270.1 DoxX family protein [Galbibacter mesophilus]